MARPLPAQGVGLDELLTELAEVVIPHGLRNGAPGFTGWITTAPTTAGTAATLAATVAGSQRWWLQPFNYLESVALRWLAELLGIPPSWQGTFTGGGSSANIVGLGAARQSAFERLGHDPARAGVPGHAGRIYASTEVHHVVVRAAGRLEGTNEGTEPAVTRRSRAAKLLGCAARRFRVRSGGIQLPAPCLVEDNVFLTAPELDAQQSRRALRGLEPDGLQLRPRPGNAHAVGPFSRADAAAADHLVELREAKTALQRVQDQARLGR